MALSSPTSPSIGDPRFAGNPVATGDPHVRFGPAIAKRLTDVMDKTIDVESDDVESGRGVGTRFALRLPRH